uniref:RING-type domain-containing protein n=1 Tax=Caenorhabditis tropicalis TaxID=1561998 RepID=A0A1I7UGG2_9PELO
MDVLGCLLNGDDQFAELVTDIIKCLKPLGNSYVTSYAGKEEVNCMQLEELEELLMASVVVRVLIENYSHRKGSNRENREDFTTFINWIQEKQNLIKNLVNEEIGKVKKENNCYRSLKQHYWDKTPENELIIKGIEDQKLNQDQFRIAKRLIELEKSATRQAEQRAPQHRPEVSTGHVRRECVPYHRNKDDTLQQNVSQTRGDFRNLLNSKKLPDETSTFDFASRPPMNAPLPIEDNSNEEEENRRLEKLKEDHERFEMEVSNKRNESSRKDELMRQEKARRDEETEREFRETVKKQEKEIQESFQKFKQEMEDYEKETQRLLEERQRKWHEFEASFVACVLIKEQFENKEKEWGNWLKSLSDSISNVKTRYNLFQKIVRNISKNGENHQKMIERELTALHKTTLSAYELLFEACDKVKTLGEKFPDGVFLAVLHKKLSEISNKLCNALENVDHCLNSQSTDLSNSFSDLRPNEIPTTDQLRRDSQKSPYSTFGSDPRVYGSSSFVVIEEMEDHSGRVETYF